MMKPSSTENPVARTPNTPDARSPSVKKLPSGARRRTRSMAVTVIAVTTATMRAPATMFMPRNIRVGRAAVNGSPVRRSAAERHVEDLLGAVVRDAVLVAQVGGGHPHPAVRRRLDGPDAAVRAVEVDRGGGQ